jgi:hypothetical protein
MRVNFDKKPDEEFNKNWQKMNKKIYRKFQKKGQDFVKYVPNIVLNRMSFC